MFKMEISNPQKEHNGQVESALEKLLAIQADDTPPSYEEVVNLPPVTPPRSLKPKLRPPPAKPQLPAFCAQAELRGVSNTFRSRQLEGL